MDTHEPIPQGNPNLPSGFKEVVHSDKVLIITKNELPWLKDDEKIPLVKITLTGTNGKTFYYGSCIRGHLVEAAKKLDMHQSRFCNNLLYSHLPTLIQNGSHPYIKIVSSQVTEKPIYYFSNIGGNRVYFMRFNEIDGKPVILRIAVCDKSGNGQEIVLGALTNNQQKVIKKVARL